MDKYYKLRVAISKDTSKGQQINSFLSLVNLVSDFQRIKRFQVWVYYLNNIKENGQFFESETTHDVIILFLYHAKKRHFILNKKLPSSDKQK